MSTRKQQRSAPISTRKNTRLQQLYKRVTKSKANMVISAAIFATVMGIVGLFVTSKGAPLPHWNTLRDLLTKTGPGRMLANLIQKLIDLVCGLLGIGINEGSVVEFKDEDKTACEEKSLGKGSSGDTEYPTAKVTGKMINDNTGVTEYVVVALDGDTLKLKAYDVTVTKKNYKNKKTDAEKGLMVTRAIGANDSNVKKPDDYCQFNRSLFKATKTKLEKE